VSLFQRIKTPFGEMADDDPAPPDSAYAVGTLLRERREELGLDLSTIGEALRIKPLYLAALEQGLTEDLPGPAYAAGFIRAYAQYLGLDADRVLDSYKADTTDVQSRPDLSLPVPLGARSLPGVPILLVALILALLGYGTWYYLSTGDRARPERVAAVPAELRQPPPPPTAAPSDGAGPAPRSGSAAAADAPRLSPGILAPRGVAPAPTGAAPGAPSPDAAARPEPAALPSVAAPPPASSAPSAAAPSPAPGPAADRGQIDIRALADCWIQVRLADTQAVVFSRVLKAGETYRVPRPGLLLRTGNAGALAIVVDGKPAPAIGGIGVLRRNVALEPEALLAGTASRG
jgi:cytoskeleton protein RodZ